MNIYTVDDIKKIVSPIAEAHGLEKVCLFGSYARNEKATWIFRHMGLSIKT